MEVLNRIEIAGLFGHYTYDLPLRAGLRKKICFLTGPNGYGKSTILRLVYAFLKMDVATLLAIPYDSLTFYLKDYKVVLQQARIENNAVDEDSSSSDEDIYELCKLTIVVFASDGGAELERVSFDENDIEDENAKVFPPSLSVYLASLNVEYIQDDRLQPRNADKLGVSTHVSLLQEKLSNYDAYLTATYKEQLLATMRSFTTKDMTMGQLEESDLLKRANAKLTAFNRLGLALKLTDANLLGVEHSLLLLQMSVVDKVLSYDDIFYRRLNLLYDIITHSEFSDKSLVLDTKNGLYFVSDDTIIIPEELSSGEQHFIIQLIMLLMKAEPGSLILIDEPELSYHPAWQMDYLKNLKRIAEIGEYQFLLATHSPQIFDYRWGYTIDLYKQTTNDAEGAEERS